MPYSNEAWCCLRVIACIFVFPSHCSLHQRPQHGHNLTILDIRGVSELLSLFLPQGFQFRALFDVAQNSGNIRNLLCRPAMVCGCLQRIRKHCPVEFLGCCQNIGMTISELKRSVVEILATTLLLKQEFLFQKITRRLMKAVAPVRPNRSESCEKSTKLQNTRKTGNIFSFLGMCLS